MLAGNADYATAASDTNSDGTVEATTTQNSNTTNTTTSNNDSTVTGYQGAASDLVVKYRSSLINVDTMILQEIEDCFMLVLNNGDEYFARDSYYGGY